MDLFNDELLALKKIKKTARNGAVFFMQKGCGLSQRRLELDLVTEESQIF